jgi:hypothetical protein
MLLIRNVANTEYYVPGTGMVAVKKREKFQPCGTYILIGEDNQTNKQNK